MRKISENQQNVHKAATSESLRTVAVAAGVNIATAVARVVGAGFSITYGVRTDPAPGRAARRRIAEADGGSS